MAEKNLHPIRVVAKRSGLTAHTIRAWEKRYGAIEPQRSETKRRLYSDEDIQKLILLRLATEAGYRIGEIAGYSSEKLRDLLKDVAHTIPETIDSETLEVENLEASSYLEKSLNAILNFDNDKLENNLNEAMIDLGELAMIEKFLIPLLHKIGDLWEKGTIRTAQEHMASAVIRTFVGNMLSSHIQKGNAPHITVTTPAGQAHENGALVAAAIAASDGWNVTYLGPNLTAEEIAGASRKKSSQVIALSMVYPHDDPRINAELQKIRKFVGNEVKIIVGGAAADSYSQTISEINAIYEEKMSNLRTVLREIRKN
ncbi:MAG: MerR family transcriptional regulator [candidate division Zixibacteria bacterium]|nr:MerR family transcriptional regulator [candidate division Zixibacteria bacterium]